jgi:hypothetical protein
MMHSMDFHARWSRPRTSTTRSRPGRRSRSNSRSTTRACSCHCGTPMILEHIASGMYGMLIAEPRGGYPTKVDREYAIVQSEFYTRPDPNRRTVGANPLFVLDPERVRTKASTYTVFNGVYNGMVDRPLPAKAGDRVRLYVRRRAQQHVQLPLITIFDRVDRRKSKPVPRRRRCAASGRRQSSSAGGGKRDGRPSLRERIAGGTVGYRRTGGTPELLEHHNPRAPTPTRPGQSGSGDVRHAASRATRSAGRRDRPRPAYARRGSGGPRAGSATGGVLAQDDSPGVVARFKIAMPNQNLTDRDIRQLIEYLRWAERCSRGDPGPRGRRNDAHCAWLIVAVLITGHRLGAERRGMKSAARTRSPRPTTERVATRRRGTPSCSPRSGRPRPATPRGASIAGSRPAGVDARARRNPTLAARGVVRVLGARCAASADRVMIGLAWARLSLSSVVGGPGDSPRHASSRITRWRRDGYRVTMTAAPRSGRHGFCSPYGARHPARDSSAVGRNSIPFSLLGNRQIGFARDPGLGDDRLPGRRVRAPSSGARPRRVDGALHDMRRWILPRATRTGSRRSASADRQADRWMEKHDPDVCRRGDAGVLSESRIGAGLQPPWKSRAGVDRPRSSSWKFT